MQNFLYDILLKPFVIPRETEHPKPRKDIRDAIKEEDQVITQWRTFLEKIFNKSHDSKEADIWGYLGNLPGSFLADTHMQPISATNNEANKLKDLWAFGSRSVGHNKLNFAHLDLLSPTTVDRLYDESVWVTPWSVVLLSLSVGLLDYYPEDQHRNRKFSDPKLARRLLFDPVADLASFVKMLRTREGGAYYRAGEPRLELKDFRKPGYMIMLSPENIDRSISLFNALLQMTLLDGDEFGGAEWTPLYREWSSTVLDRLVATSFSTTSGNVASLSRSALLMTQAFDRTPASGDNGKTLARNEYIRLSVYAVKRHQDWVPGFHPDDVLGSHLLSQISFEETQKATANTTTAGGKASEGVCRDFFVNMMLPLCDPGGLLNMNSSGIRRTVDPYLMHMWLPNLLPEHAVCVRQQTLDADHVVYEIPGPAGLPALDFCLSVGEIKRLQKEQKILDSRSGVFGSSTRIQFRPSPDDPKKRSHQPVRMKQALLVSSDGKFGARERLRVGSLLDLMTEGYNGLFAVNEAINANVGLGPHLVRTHHFAFCDKLSDLRLVTDHVEHNCGTMHTFFEENLKKQFMQPVLSNLVEQLIIVVFVLNYDWGIFHNDLHWNNILVQEVFDNAGPMTYRLNSGKSYTLQPVKLNGRSYRVVIIDYGRMCQIEGTRKKSVFGTPRHKVGEASMDRLNSYLRDEKFIFQGRASDLTQNIALSVLFNTKIFSHAACPSLSLSHAMSEIHKYSLKEMRGLNLVKMIIFNEAVVYRYSIILLPLFVSSSTDDAMKKFLTVRTKLEQAVSNHLRLPSVRKIRVCTHGMERMMAVCPQILPELSLFSESKDILSTPKDRLMLASVRVKNMFMLLVGFINLRSENITTFCQRLDSAERYDFVLLVYQFYMRWLPVMAPWYERVANRRESVFESITETAAALSEDLETSWLRLRYALEAPDANGSMQTPLSVIRQRYRFLSDVPVQKVSPLSPPKLEPKNEQGDKIDAYKKEGAKNLANNVDKNHHLAAHHEADDVDVSAKNVLHERARLNRKELDEAASDMKWAGDRTKITKAAVAKQRESNEIGTNVQNVYKPKKKFSLMKMLINEVSRRSREDMPVVKENNLRTLDEDGDTRMTD